MLTSQSPIRDAVRAYRIGDYGLATKLYQDALQRYPHWQSWLYKTLEIMIRRCARYSFGLSREAVVKKVPPKPANFPEGLTLPALRGVANDYSFIEEMCEEYWRAHSEEYTLPVSVVIPVFNRLRELDFVLAGLTHQTYPKNLIEVVIADDGSEEDLAPIIKKYHEHFKILYCRQEDLGYRLAEARNLGIRTATHDSIIILDSDAIPTETLVEQYMRRFHVYHNAAMFGLRHYVSVENISVSDFLRDSSLVSTAQRVRSENTVATSTSPSGQHSADWRDPHIRGTNGLKDEGLPYRFLVGANCAFSRELFVKVGGYSADFRAWGFEDQEFGYRLYREGAYFIFLPDAYVFHQEPINGKNDTDRKLGQAITKDIFVQKCPFIYRKRSKKNPPFEIPLVSIYVPLHNREDYIVECIQSALDQTVKDLEVCICDDGSTDRSVERLGKYFGRNPRVRLIRQANAGIGAASNTAVRYARGFYIGQLDADDVLKRDAVERCLEVMEKNHRLSLVYGTTEYIDENSCVISDGWNWPLFSREYLLTRMICHHFRFFRKRDWSRTAGFDETIINAVDYDMVLKLAEVGEVFHLNRVLYQYRKHADTTTVKENPIQTQNNFHVINQALKRFGLDEVRAHPANEGGNGARDVKFIFV